MSRVVRDKVPVDYRYKNGSDIVNDPVLDHASNNKSGKKKAAASAAKDKENENSNNGVVAADHKENHKKRKSGSPQQTGKKTKKAVDVSPSSVSVVSSLSSLSGSSSWSSFGSKRLPLSTLSTHPVNSMSAMKLNKSTASSKKSAAAASSVLLSPVHPSLNDSNVSAAEGSEEGEGQLEKDDTLLNETNLTDTSISDELNQVNLSTSSASTAATATTFSKKNKTNERVAPMTTINPAPFTSTAAPATFPAPSPTTTTTMTTHLPLALHATIPSMHPSYLSAATAGVAAAAATAGVTNNLMPTLSHPHALAINHTSHHHHSVANEDWKQVAEQRDQAYDILLSKYNKLREEKRMEHGSMLEEIAKRSQEAYEKTQEMARFWKEQLATYELKLAQAEQAKLTAELQEKTKTEALQRVEKENELLKGQLATLMAKYQELEQEKRLSASSASSTSTSKDVQALEEKHAKIMDAYILLTSTRVTLLDNGWIRCKLLNRSERRVIEFELNLNEEDNEDGNLEYVPKKVDLGGVEYPDWLTQTIAMKPEMTPRLMRIMLSTIYKQVGAPDQEEEGSE